MIHSLAKRLIGFFIGSILCTTALWGQQFVQATEIGTIGQKSYPIHASDLLWKQELEVREYIKAHPSALQRTSLKKTTSFSVGATKSWYADNLITQKNSDRYLVPSTCRAVGTNCYIFVEDASWGSRVSQSSVDSVRIYFDSKTPANPAKGIYQTDVDAFGNPPDVDNDPKIIILMMDIKDGYTSGGTNGYVEGYFYSFNEIDSESPGYSTSNFAEIFYLDTNPLDLATTSGLYGGLSTLAHEFQHMIHFNYDRNGNELTFVKEGCSVLAEVNCGFPIYPQSYYAAEPNHYLLDWRRDDYTAVLNDYSRAARFFVYLRDQVGMGLFRPLVASASTLTGTAGINAALQSIGAGVQFSDILQNWFIANILNDRSVDTKYGYIYPNLPKSKGRVFLSPNVSVTNDTVQNYAVQYINFKNGSQLKATFTVSNPALIVKAVEIGASSKRVVNVTSGVEFSEPLYGSTYTEVHFVVMNTDPSLSYTFTYQASGASKPIELMYDYTEPVGVLPLAANDTVCVTFDAVQDGSLDSIRVALRRSSTIRGGIWRSTGLSSPSPLGQPITTNLTVKGLSTPPSPYPVPWPNWVTIDVRSLNINTNTPFAVAFIVEGAYSTTDGTTYNYVMTTLAPVSSTPTSFSYSSESTSGAKWYNFVSSTAPDMMFNYLIRAYVSFPASVLYPGDANNDGIVDARDILPIGLYYGKTGSPRLNGSNTWQKQYIDPPWTPEQAGYADCDGNGKIDSNDVIAIIQNWNATRTGGVPAGLVRSAICQELLQEIDRNGATGPMRSIRNAISSYMNQSLVEHTDNVPLNFALYQNYPNPFNPSTTIHFTFPQKIQEVRLSIFNILGQLVWEKVLSGIEAGTYDVSWAGETFSGSKVGSGIYIYKLKAGSYHDVKKMILIK
ncbi:MAG: T9SS type A sorting domain-containing protein [Ignavibacteriales bacterium]|nr:T9SS type A sorting domain-containing protein [Ignavibacteriales bacterium]